MYQNQQEEETLNKLRRQLGILQRSGGSASQIHNLQQQITQKEKDAYFNSQQQQIDAIKTASDLEIERLDAQIDLMTETLEYQKNNGLLWEQVAQVMKGTPESIGNFITQNGKEWMNYSTTKWDNEYRILNGQIELWTSYANDTEAYRTTWNGFQITVADAIAGLDEHSWNTYDEAMYRLFGEKWEGVRDAAYKYYSSHYDTSADPNYAAMMTNQTAEIKQMIDAAMGQRQNAIPLDSKAYQETPTNKGNNGGQGGGQGGGTPSGGGGPGGGGNANKEQQVVQTKMPDTSGTVSLQYYCGAKKLGSDTKKVARGYYDTSKWKKTYSGYVFSSVSPTSITVSSGGNYTVKYYYDPHNYKNLYEDPLLFGDANMKPFSTGGIVDYTGPALVHGSKTRPEAVLNADQTRILREDILGKGRYSLMSSLADFNATLNATADASKYSASTTNISSSDGQVVIEHAEVNLNASIASDYDARRAGSLVMDEMVKIGRKTGFQNNIRR